MHLHADLITGPRVLTLCLVTSKMPNSHEAYLSNPSFDIWSPKWLWLDKDWSKCILYTDTRETKASHICCTGVPESQISIYVTPWGAIVSYRLLLNHQIYIEHHQYQLIWRIKLSYPTSMHSFVAARIYVLTYISAKPQTLAQDVSIHFVGRQREAACHNWNS